MNNNSKNLKSISFDEMGVWCTYLLKKRVISFPQTNDSKNETICVKYNNIITGIPSVAAFECIIDK